MSGPVLYEVDPETLEGMERPIPRAGLTAGRSRDNLLVIDGLRASRRQFSITFDGKQWWVQDLKSAAGTLLNGRKLGLREALAHHDVLSLPNARDPWWLFLECSPARHPELERAIVEQDRPEDWLVYADWLQQEGDPLGQLIVRHSLPNAPSWAAAEDAPAPLRPLKLDFRFGFWRAAELSGEKLLYEWPAFLAMLLHWPQGRFLRELRVDLARFLRGADAEARALYVDRILQHAPSSLEHLELGDGFEHGLGDAELRHRLPRWDGRPFARWTLRP